MVIYDPIERKDHTVQSVAETNQLTLNKGASSTLLVYSKPTTLIFSTSPLLRSLGLVLYKFSSSSASVP